MIDEVLFPTYYKVCPVGSWPLPVLISLVPDSRVVTDTLQIDKPPDWLPDPWSECYSVGRGDFK